MATPEEKVPKVFISSTCEDLQAYRESARDAALKSGFYPVLSENFAASGAAPPLETCLKEVGSCDLLVVIVAHRYGWVPPFQPNKGHKSITWLECEQALKLGIEVVALMVEEAAPWPTEDHEDYQAALEIQKPTWNSERMAEIKKNVEALREFKEWLRGRGIRGTFASPEQLRSEMIAALNHWRFEHLSKEGESLAADVEFEDPTKALRMLQKQTGFIDIRGLQVGSGKANRIPIDELYIPLTSQDGKTVVSEDGVSTRNVELHETLVSRKVILIGDPGSGKTTFLRRIAHALCESILGGDPDAARTKLGISGDPPLPLLIRLFELQEFIARTSEREIDNMPTSKSSPEWLLKYLSRISKEFAWGLSEDYFKDQLETGTSLLLFDGLDETPSQDARRVLAELIENIAATYDMCRFVVTSRPKAYVGEAVMTSFDSVRVAPLNEEAINVFIQLWCERLFPQSPDQATSHREELTGALKARLEIRRMATNPVMLTALAVVHWNEKRIPEQRAELYESIITWLSRSRQVRPERPSAERCVALLQHLALGMQNHEKGRQIQVRRHWAAEQLASDFESNRRQGASKGIAERFLEEEELDSGVVIGRGDDIRFWHLSFQEYLAARALSGLSELRQRKVVLKDADKLVSSEWRETILLFFGVLHRQGAEKVDSMFAWILKAHGGATDLSPKAQLVGLRGEILRDLRPLDYKFDHKDYRSLLKEVMTVFQARSSRQVPLELRLEVANALGQAGDPRLVGDSWVLIPAGTFLIGCQDEDPNSVGFDPYALLTEGPPYVIELSDFEIGRYPVSVQEYRRFVDADGYQEARFWSHGGFDRWQEPEQWESQVRQPNHPVVGVSWFEALAYCSWMGGETSLPLENQWESAARGSGERRFPWGQSPPEAAPKRSLDEDRLDGGPANERCNYARLETGGTTPVGFFEAGATQERVQDMAGNVFEWCQDVWERYPPSVAKSDQGQSPKQIVLRVVRGGSYRSSVNFLRCAFRGRYPADFRGSDVGFRLCRSKSSTAYHQVT